jgi:hypothetical protein
LEDTEGVKFTLQLEQTQRSLDNLEDSTKNCWDTTRRDELANAVDRTKSLKPLPDRPAGNPSPNSATDEERCYSEATQRIKEERRKAKSILDQQNEECKLLFTHRVHQIDNPHKNYNLDNLAAQAAQTQLDEREEDFKREWKAKRRNTEELWDQKRKAIEQQSKESLAEEATLQLSRITHETNKAHQAHAKLQKEMTKTNHTL